MRASSTHTFTALKKTLAAVLACAVALANASPAFAITYDSSTTTYFETVDDYGLASGSDSIGLRFGGTLGEYLRFNQSGSKFVLTDDLDVQGTISGAALKIVGTAALSGALVLEGGTTMSGSAIQGFGLTDCDTGASSKLLWDATTGKFSCGTDQTGGSSGSTGGLSMSDADLRYVNQSGDTMTGRLIIKPSSIVTSGALTISRNLEYQTGALIYASGAAVLSLQGPKNDNGATGKHILFGSQSSATYVPFDTNLYRGGSNTLKTDGTFVASSIVTDSASVQTSLASQGTTNLGDSTSDTVTVTGTFNANGLSFFGNTSTHAGVRVTAGTSTNSYVDFYENTTKSANLYWDGTNDRFVVNDAGVGNTVINPSAGNVGVRTTSPKAELDVVGTISGSSLSGFGLHTDCDTGASSKLLYDITTGKFSCGTDSGSSAPTFTRIAGSSGAAGSADTVWQNLTSNSANCTTTALCTVMTTTGVGVGTWHFKYTLIYQTASTTTGISYGINHTGTAGQFQAHWFHPTSGIGAATGVGDNDTATVAGQMVEGKAEGVLNAVIGSASAGVTVVNSDILAILEGIIVVAGSGNLEFKIGSEVAGSAVRVMADSVLELTKVE